MKNYLDKEDLILGVEDILNTKIIDNANCSFEQFLLEISSEEAQKLKLIKENKFIKYFTFALVENLNVSNVYKSLNFFSYNFNEPTPFSKELIELKETKEQLDIRNKINIKTEIDANILSFKNLINSINKNVKNTLTFFLFYKRGANITPHSHNQTDATFHLLLNDIEDGFLEVQVNGELRKFNKKGEWFGFFPKHTHSACMTGVYCKTLSILVPKYYTQFKAAALG